jgi:hypothetical protein
MLGIVEMDRERYHHLLIGALLAGDGWNQVVGRMDRRLDRKKDVGLASGIFGGDGLRGGCFGVLGGIWFCGRAGELDAFLEAEGGV